MVPPASAKHSAAVREELNSREELLQAGTGRSTSLLLLLLGATDRNPTRDEAGVREAIVHSSVSRNIHSWKQIKMLFIGTDGCFHSSVHPEKQQPEVSNTDPRKSRKIQT